MLNTMKQDKISIIIPAKNEAASLVSLLPDLKNHFPDAEIIVVNDGSTDNTSLICQDHNIIAINQPYSMGNGASIKTGARRASGDILVFMDGDGQHKPQYINKLLLEIEHHDMVIASRNASSQASFGRWVANSFYNWFASRIVEQKVKDLTSGFRVVKAKKFMPFLYMLPNGFSYPTTITMAFFRSAYRVKYVDIKVEQRIGKSHIKPLRDAVRFLLIIFRVGTLFSPLKIFFPISLLFFVFGVANYISTYIAYGKFTNMSALLLITSVLVFLIGLVSEQITTLLYSKQNPEQ